MNVHMYPMSDVQEINHKLVVLEEWERVQRHLLAFALVASCAPALSWRSAMEACIHQISCGRARILWESPPEYTVDGDQLIEIRYQQVCYGMLKLTSRYLISYLLPNIPNDFAHLCALILTFIEHRMLVQQLLKPLQPLAIHESLTAREQDILLSLAYGESEIAAAQQLNIAPTTVRTHRHSLYRRLEVSSPYQVVLRSFTLRLLNWLDLPVDRN